MRGRRSLYRAEFHPDEARRLAETGLFEREIAKGLGISLSTLKTWKQQFPPFLAALIDGKRKPMVEIEAAVRNRALGLEKVREIHYRPGKKEGDPAIPVRIVERNLPSSTRAQEFWLVNRMPRRWKRKITFDMAGDAIHSQEKDPEKLAILRKNVLLLMGVGANGEPHKRNDGRA